MKQPFRWVAVGLFLCGVGRMSAQADLVGFYPFDNAGSPLTDGSGKGNTLTSAGADPTYEPDAGLSGGVFRFDGSQRLVVPLDINPGTYPQMTMGAWVRTGSLAPDLRKIMGHDDGGWDRTIGLDNRNAPLRYATFLGTGLSPEGTPEPRSTEDWTFIAAVYDDVVGETTLYVNLDANTVGDELAANTFASQFGFGHETASIGNLRPDVAAEGWIGQIDNAFFFDQLLTKDELTGFRNRASPSPGAQADPNFSAVSVPDLSNLAKAPATHDFSIPIRNDGATKALNITSVTVTGLDSSFYTVRAFPNQVAAGQQGAIDLTLAPQGQVGAFQAALRIASDDSIQPRTTLGISANVASDGTSDPTVAVVTPDPVFGERGTAPTTVDLQIRNTGAAQTLRLTSAVVVGPDAARYTVGSFPETLAAGATGTIRITFDPMGEAKSFSAQLNLYSNDAAGRLKVIDLSAVVKAENIRQKLIGFYSFDDAASPRKDDSGNGKDLQESDVPPVYDPQGGREGGGFAFDGGQRLIAPININPSAIPELTLGAWVRSAILDPGLRKVMGHDDGGWDRTIGLDNREGDFRYAAFVGNGSPLVGLPGPESEEHWTFFATTFNQTLREVVGYVDLDTSSTGDALVSASRPESVFGTGFSTFSIGNLRPDNSAEGWWGSIDNVFVYNAVLSAEQLTAIRNGGKGVILAAGPPPAPRITTVTVAAAVTLVWTSAPGASYSVQYLQSVPGTWAAIATQASQGNTTSYQDTDATRRARPTGFYRIAVQ